MYRARLRPKYSDEELAKIYATPHDATRWRDHLVRVETTVAAASWLLDSEDNGYKTSIADLSCGNALIPTLIRDRYAPYASLYLGDFAPKYSFTGPVEKTIDQIPYVDMFIFSETIEHVDDPDTVLRQIRAKSKTLVLTTPDGETDPNLNPEHYWGWDSEAMKYMLLNAGWNPETLTTLAFNDPEYIYTYQIWTCT